MSGDLRYGLNVAACDDRPLALVVDSGEGDKALRSKLGSLAWTDEFWGSFTYAEAKSQDLKAIDGAVGRAGILFVQPDEYGVRGRSLGFVDAGAPDIEMAKAMREALARFKPRGETDHRQHLIDGVKKGIRWRSAIPCEDQQAVQATKRLWGG